MNLDLPITTGRLTLRRLTPDDLDDFSSYHSRPDVARYLYREPRTRDECRDILERQQTATFGKEGDELLLAVEHRDTPGIVGEVVLMWRSELAMQAEIGWIFHPDVGGHGYATEAARALVNLACTTAGFHRVFARLDEANTASARICERLGMRQEARLIENDRTHDQWGTELIYALLAREWDSASHTHSL